MAFRLTFQKRGEFEIVQRNIVLPVRQTGLRIVVASDIHADESWFPAEAVERVVEAINAVKNVDVVVLPGDFVTNNAASIEWSAPILAQIVHPVFATLGNHDAATNPQRISDVLQREGIPVLDNRAVEYTGGAWIAGVDSMWGGRCDVDRALSTIPNDAPTVVVGHEPKIATMHKQFLHIAGHTHHGQGRLPLIGHQFARLYYPRHSAPFHKGLYDLGNRYVYTTAGVGYTFISFRLNCPSEIVVIDA